MHGAPPTTRVTRQSTAAHDGAASPDHQGAAPGAQAAVKPLVIVASVVAAIGGLIFGYDIGGSGGTFTMKGFRNHLGWPILGAGEADPSNIADIQGWITAVFALGAAAGSLVCGFFTDRFGRRPTLMLYAAIFIVAAILMGASENLATLYAGRFIGGIGVGGLSMTTTMYQSEIAPERIRGALIALQQLCITAGILIAGIANVGLQHWDEGWRLSYSANGSCAVIMFVLMFFCPESPRWLYKVGRTADCRATLLKVLQPEEVDAEFERIAEDERLAVIAAKSRWADLFMARNNMNWRTMCAVSILFMQQLTGINAVFYFAPVIFHTFLDSQLSLLCNLLLTAVNFLCTFVAIAFVDKYGRRSLLVYGAFSMAVFCVIVTLLSSDLANYKTDKAVGWTIVGFLAVYVMSFSYSWGPVGWIVPAEIYLNELRGKGMTLSTTANWLCNFAVGKFTPSILLPKNFNLWGTFLFFGGFCVLMGFFTLLCVPETAQVALEDMDVVLVKFRKLSLWHRLTHINMVNDPAVKVTDMSGFELSKQKQAAMGAVQHDPMAPVV